MKQNFKNLIIFCLLIFVLSSCNIGIKAPATANPLGAASTIVALTLQAQEPSTAPSVSAATPFASPVAPTATTKPTLYINNNNSKCRSGPNLDANVIATLSKGTTLDLIAKDTAGGFWLVKYVPTGDICWVQTQDATPGGSFGSLPEVTPQPTANTSVPNRPGSINFNFNCIGNSVTTTLTWTDTANNEKGYHVYRSGTLIADLPPNSKSYTDTIDIAVGGQYSYSIEAYNDAGASPQRSTNSPIACQ